MKTRTNASFAYLALAFALGLALAAPASAQGNEDNAGPYAPCKDDVHKFCPDVQLGEGRMAHCMRMHYFRLSKECKAAIKAARAQKQTPRSGDAGAVEQP
jgi:hypothetical protein